MVGMKEDGGEGKVVDGHPYPQGVRMAIWPRMEEGTKKAEQVIC
jgi:hypothetical protein